MSSELEWSSFQKLFRDECLKIDDLQIQKLEQFVKLLREWNTKVNLVSRKDDSNILPRHILPSVAVLLKFQLGLSSSIIDVGTGGGFPGIPLAILLPSVRVTLLDSIRKKMDAVGNIVSELQLENVSVVCGRAEDVAQDKSYFQKYDYVIARAVAPIKDCVKWSRSFLHPSSTSESLTVSASQSKPFITPGTILLLKGGNLSDEVRQASSRLKPKRIEVHSLAVDGIDGNPLAEKKLVLVKP